LIQQDDDYFVSIPICYYIGSRNALHLAIKMKDKQERYFECLEVCTEGEQEDSCRAVCTPILNDDDEHHPTVPLKVHHLKLTEAEIDTLIQCAPTHIRSKLLAFKNEPWE